jgi:hypothetical protein
VEGEIVGLAFSPDGKSLAVANNRGSTISEISVWDTKSGKSIWKQATQNRLVASLAFSPNGKVLATGDQNGLIRLWQANTGNTFRQFRGTGSDRTLLSCAPVFSPDGRTLAVGSQASKQQGGMVRLWEIASGTVRWESSGPQGAVSSLAFSRDGRILALGSMDTSILLWELWKDPREDRQNSRDLSSKELEELWSDLSASDAQKAFKTMKQLAGAKQAVTFLKQHLRAVVPRPVNAKDVANWIKDLDADEFSTRQEATRELKQAGKAAESALQETLKKNPSTEMRRRVELLLDDLETTEWDLQIVGPLRALEILEYVGSPEAQELLKELTLGEAKAEFTQEAKAALSRLSHRIPSPEK